MRRPPGRISVVGDDDQAIYAFQGASGSFRPFDNDWFKDAYLSNGAAKFSDDLLASFSTPRPEL